MMLFGKTAPPAGYIADPYSFLADLRRHDPIGYVDDREMWVATGFDAVSRLLRMPGIELTSTSTFADRSPAFRASLAHQLRLWFKPPLSEDIHQIVTKAVAEAVAAVLEKSDADLVPALARRIPMQVMAAMLGIPDRDLPMLTELGQAVLWGYDLSWQGREPQAARIAQSLICTYFRQSLTDSAAGHGAPLRQILLACWQQHQLPDDSLHDAFCKLVTAGVTTTASTLGNILIRLLSGGVDYATDVAPGPQEAQLEEFLRLDAAILGIYRRVGVDLNIDGHIMRKGQTVLLLTAAANRDPDRFPDPDRFWPARPDNRHLSFGQGAFYCLGAYLARLEIACVLQAVLPSLHRIRLSAPPSYRQGWLLHEAVSIPVSIAPAA